MRRKYPCIHILIKIHVPTNKDETQKIATKHWLQKFRINTNFLILNLYKVYEIYWKKEFYSNWLFLIFVGEKWNCFDLSSMKIWWICLSFPLDEIVLCVIPKKSSSWTTRIIKKLVYNNIKRYISAHIIKRCKIRMHQIVPCKCNKHINYNL